MSFLKPTPATSSSTNVNNDLIKSSYGGAMGQGTAAMGDLSKMLGVGNPNGYSNYLQTAGFAPAMRQLSQNVTGQGAASGILNSGSTAKALQSRGAEVNNQFYNNYLQQLAGLSGLGLQAGGLVANAGQQSKSNGGGPSTVGSIASTIGGIASIFSDRRLKRDIELIRREADGLGIYLCRYVWSRTRRLMVMADEVAKLRPWALGRRQAGFATVNYGAL
jgi:hypothetical protein